MRSTASGRRVQCSLCLWRVGPPHGAL